MTFLRSVIRFFFATMFIGWGLRLLAKEKGIPGKLEVCAGQIKLCNHAIEMSRKRREQNALLNL